MLLLYKFVDWKMFAIVPCNDAETPLLHIKNWNILQKNVKTEAPE